MTTELTWADIEQESKRWEGRGPRLVQYAEFINKHFPQYEASIEPCSYRSKRKLYAHISSFGKRREGKGLVVRNRYTRKLQRPVFEHNPLEPYRRNSDVALWIWRHRDEAGGE